MRKRYLAAIGAVVLVVALAVAWFIHDGKSLPVTAAPASTGLTAVYSAPPEPNQNAQLKTLPHLGTDGTLSAARVQELWDPFAQIAKENEWTPWGYVVDADTGEVLLEKLATTGHVPASTMKVLTGLVALNALDPLGTLTTGVSQAGNELYLWGEGDLLLSAGESTGQVEGQASLSELAELTAAALSAQNVTAVHLTYQTLLFEGEKRLPLWVQQEVEDYAGDVGPYAIDTGRTQPGEWEFVADSSAEVAAAFAEQLAELGVEIEGIRAGNPNLEARQIAQVSSAPIYAQLAYMLRASDNTMAEQYCHLAAQSANYPTTFQGATQNLRDSLDRLGVTTEGMRAEDCSGLSLTSKVTPQTLVEAMRVSTGESADAAELIRLFPRGGVDGTLGARFEEAPAAGNLQAKTGSLGSVSSLAGILTTEEGQNLLFAVGVDDAPEWTAYYAREPIDDFILGLIAG